MKRIAWNRCIAALFGAMALATSAAQIETRTLKFARGASAATAKGAIQGDHIVDYRVRALAGQTMSVSIKSSHAANYFNVLPPGSRDAALFVGSSGGNEWTGELPASGNYTVRVYLMRSAARRDESARYELSVAVSGKPAAASAPAPTASRDAKVPGTPYHATGKVPCSMGNAPAGSAQCDFGVIRGKPGNAEVHVTPPGGFERVITFAGSKVGVAGGGTVKSSRSGDDWIVEVNDYENYRIPDAVISGG